MAPTTDWPEFNMDARGFALVMLLVFLSGLIAYIGDYVGRKVGKKRITLFNLRPKHTSIIITIVSGILIVSTTLAVLFTFSEYARKSFFRYGREVGKLSGQKKDLERANSNYMKQQNELRAEIRSSQKENDKSARALKTSQKELDNIIGKINLKSIEFEKLKGMHAGLQKDHETLKSELKSVEMETKELRARKAQLEKDIQTSVERLSTQSVEILYGQIIYHRDQLLARVIVSKNISEQDLRTRMLMTINAILADAVERGAKVDQDTGAIFNEQFKDLKKVVKNTKNDVIVDLLAANNVFKNQQIYIKLRTFENRRLYSKGEAIVEQQFPVGLDRDKVSQMISAMIHKVSQGARTAGVMPLDPSSQQVGALNAKKYVQAVNLLAGSREPKNAKIISLKDTRVSDQLLIDIVVEPIGH